MVAFLGSWMQTVGAQWFLVDRAPHLAAVVQTAATAPYLLFALVAGALADMVDRRTLLVAAQYVSFAVSGATAVLAATGSLSPLMLLALTFLLGACAALYTPAWQTVSAESVEHRQLPQAATLTAIVGNATKAIGPALGGALVVVSGPSGVFAVNAVTFLVAGVVLTRYMPAGMGRTGAPRESMRAAVRTGVSFVRQSPVSRRVLLWAAIGMPLNGAVWALLPVLAHLHFGLGASGYGLLLGLAGVGALLGAVLLPVARRITSSNAILGAALAVSGVSSILFAFSPVVLAAVLMVPLGLGYLTVMAQLNATMLQAVATRVRARGLALFQMVVLGSLSAGSAVCAALASVYDARLVLAGAGAAMLAVIGLLAVLPMIPAPAFTPESGRVSAAE
jgi:MFS family permease